MSSTPSSTRTAILDAARRLFERPGSPQVRLADVAERAGVSRQALYLHFRSRAELLRELVQHVDEVHGFVALLEQVKQQPRGLGALHLFVESWAGYLPEIAEISRAIEHLAQADEDAAAAWQDRMRGFRGVCRLLVDRLVRDGSLADGWSADEAADLVWSTLSIGAWRALTQQRRWSQRRYVHAMKRHLERSLVAARAWQADGQEATCAP